jgi:EAL domain-containing protein (putative c-di-GMP-specific phosphodiesterase class I)
VAVVLILASNDLSLAWSAALLVGGLILFWLLLHHLMKPLQRVRQQADAIHKNQFVQQETLPASPELKSVVEAMNLMIARVQGIFEEQERTLNRYQKLLYRDQETDLGNRRYLLEHLQQSMSEESDRYHCMAIVKILDFEQRREHQGYEFSHGLIAKLAESLRTEHAGHRAHRLSRFKDDEFAFLMTSVDEEEAVEFVEKLFGEFRTRTADDAELGDIQLVAGLCDLQGDIEIGNALSNIDYCLSRAITRGPFSIEHQMSTSLDLPQGKMNWRSWLEGVLEAGDLYLVGQLAVSNDRIPAQRELFVRVRNEQGQEVSASAFMPMAASLGMSLDIDREVFRLLMSNPELDRRIPLAINLSAAFFEFAEAQEEFDQMLIDCERSNTRLCIEASHHVLDRYPAMCGRISERVRRHRHRFGVDNLDLGQPLQLLQSGQFDYVKIGAGTLHEMVRGDMTASYQALRTLGDTLDIMIIAVAVDSPEVYNDLRELGIQTMQGNFLGPPEEV